MLIHLQELRRRLHSSKIRQIPSAEVNEGGAEDEESLTTLFAYVCLCLLMFAYMPLLLYCIQLPLASPPAIEVATGSFVC